MAYNSAVCYWSLICTISLDFHYYFYQNESCFSIIELQGQMEIDAEIAWLLHKKIRWIANPQPKKIFPHY